MNRLVGFTGRKRSGKDTAAAVLNDHTKLSFAGPLKAMLRALLQTQGVGDETIDRMIEGDLKEVATPFLNGRTPRYAMQTIGTEWGRDLMSDTLWVDCLLRTAAGYEHVVVSDVRFPNESAAIREAGGVVVRVMRPGLVSNDNHPSEVLIDTLSVDAEVVNDGTIEDLNAKVQGIINKGLMTSDAT